MTKSILDAVFGRQRLDVKQYINNDYVPSWQSKANFQEFEIRSWAHPRTVTVKTKDQFEIARDISGIIESYPGIKEAGEYIIYLPDVQYKAIMPFIKFISHQSVECYFEKLNDLRGAGPGNSDCALFVPADHSKIKVNADESNVIMLYDI